MEISDEVEVLLKKVAVLAEKQQHEYVTPEHMLYVLTDYPLFTESFQHCGGDLQMLKSDLCHYFEEYLETVPVKQIELSSEFSRVLAEAEGKALSCEKSVIEIPHLISCILGQENSYAAYYIHSQGIEAAQLLSEMNSLKTEKWITDAGQNVPVTALEDFAVCLNEEIKNRPPLIGRELELERTIQILCRRDKNNPLHIGEPGVGKTAITYGLAALLNEGAVPEKLKGAKIYSVDLSAMLAGTQYRGEFEKRFRDFMQELSVEEKPIVYIDEIHMVVGAGAVNGGAMDASSLLKPYLSDGRIRFIGATTYEDYKKYFSKSKSLVRRFQNIDIKEPSIEATVTILEGLRPYYEKFHHVRYGKGAIEHAAALSSQFINERFLPDKAIDLLDEAGAYRVLHPLERKVQTVDRKLIEEVLSKICDIPKQTVENDELKKLAQLEKQMERRIFGQSEAVKQLANGVKFSRAGLNDENKPLGSYLFAGPTGVGKTETAKCLADILGIRLVRFDMSEYAEKHTVAKLIGAPAGYVGYEEGGLLTEAVRKQPNCVLLLDEIEKAHNDIYNVLLQIMDYATLTDNQGRKADFRNVILIMTSNAGARDIGKKAIGFGDRAAGEEAVLEEVKRIFSPEFRNRLDRILTFHPMDEAIAGKIVDRQLSLLEDRIAGKNIVLRFTAALKTYIRQKGFSTEYGAREINRVIHSELKPLLVDEILFGKLKKGGECLVDYQNDHVIISIKKQ